MFSIYGTLIIVIIHLSYIILYRKINMVSEQDWVNSLTGGPRILREDIAATTPEVHEIIGCVCGKPSLRTVDYAESSTEKGTSSNSHSHF
jgi:hypothetical protein